MKWVVGVDLLPDSQGALGFVAWLHAQGAAGRGDVHGLCVVEESAFFTVHGATRSKVEQGVEEAAQAFVEASPAGEAFAEVTAGFHGSIHDALGELARKHAANLVVGRQARRGEEGLVRLGKTARRLLRELPVPVAVVPPDLGADEIGTGPILLAVDVGDDSLGAVRFARAFADETGRPVRVAHILPAISDVGFEYLSPARSTELRQEHSRRAREAFEKFAAQHGLSELPHSILPGPVIEALIEVAKAERACTIVCGSRRLHTAARILSASVGTELAASATMPVFVVPPDYSPASS